MDKENIESCKENVTIKTNKQYYFLAGLFRSGNTLLSSILNQNPNIYSSPINPLCEYLFACHTIKNTYQSSLINTFPERSSNMITKMIDEYYFNVDKKIIIDREKNWAHPENIKLILEYIDNNPKIIFTTRPVLESIASQIAIDREKSIFRKMYQDGYLFNENISPNDNIAEFMMSYGSPFNNLLFSALKSIDDPKTSKMIHIVEYENLISDSENTMNKIYDFLEIDNFKHDFNNIKRIENYNESLVGHAEDFHEVRPTLSRSNIKVEDYFSQEIIDRYKNVRYF